MDKKSIFFKITIIGLILISYIFILMNISQVENLFNKCLSILTPFIYGFVIAYLINPLIKKIENLKQIKKLKHKRKLSILFSYIIVSIIIILIGLFILPNLWYSINDLIRSIPGLAEKVMNWIMEVEAKDLKLLGLEIKISEIAKEFIDTQVSVLTKNSGEYVKTIFDFTKSLSNITLNIILGIIISIYMLSNKETFKSQGKKVIYAYMKDDKANKIIKFFKDVDEKFSAFLVSKSLDSFIIGVICLIGCLIFKIENALLIAVIVGITNMIPYFGPFIGGLPCTIMAFAQSTNAGIVFGIFIIALQQFDGNILGPKLMGSKMNLNAFWIIFAVLITTGIFGIVGMILGVPLFAVVYMILKEDIKKRLEKKGKPTETTDY